MLCTYVGSATQPFDRLWSGEVQPPPVCRTPIDNNRSCGAYDMVIYNNTLSIFAKHLICL